MPKGTLGIKENCTLCKKLVFSSIIDARIYNDRCALRHASRIVKICQTCDRATLGNTNTNTKKHQGPGTSKQLQ